MASSFPQAMASLSFPAVEDRRVDRRAVYEQHCHRIYSLAFWITDNEKHAEQLAANAFLRVFAGPGVPGNEQIDAALLAEVRELAPFGCLTLQHTATVNGGLRRNIKRVHLERAVMQLPVTERLLFLLHDVEGYSHDRIGRLLGLSEHESRFGLHQARLFVRDIVVQMS
jgi:RNA polymerase sigma-70 factor (ECF subfamily)